MYLSLSLRYDSEGHPGKPGNTVCGPLIGLRNVVAPRAKSMCVFVVGGEPSMTFISMMISVGWMHH